MVERPDLCDLERAEGGGARVGEKGYSDEVFYTVVVVQQGT